MAELKKCPFCGGEVKGYADNHKKAMIECKNCNMYFGVQLEIGCELVEGWRAMFDSKEELFEAWNNRVTEAEIRAKAISDFLKALEELTQKNWIDHLEYGITWADLEEVAEQLKEE